MGSFGEHLRQQREMRGVSLDEIVATTKIGRRLLLALEEEQFDLLPGGIFNKAYVRAYAKCVGINEDEAVAEYLEASQEAPPDTKVIAHQHAFHSDRRAERSTFPVVPVLVLLVVAVGAVAGWRTYQNHRRERQESSAPAAEPATTSSAPVAAYTNSPPATGTQTESPGETNSVAVPASTSALAAKPVTTDSAAHAGQPSTNSATSAVPEGTFEVTIRPKDRAWVSVKSDGQFVVRGIIRPPDVKMIRASNEVVFYTGNAGEVEVAFNGKNVPLTGGANDEKTLVFNSKGVLQQAGAQ